MLQVTTTKKIDCEQSLFFFRFSESNARARERRSRETRETYNEHYSSILVIFWGRPSILVGKNRVLRWSILVGKQKHNVQKNPFWILKSFETHSPGSLLSYLASQSEATILTNSVLIGRGLAPSVTRMAICVNLVPRSHSVLPLAVGDLGTRLHLRISRFARRTTEKREAARSLQKKKQLY